MVQHVIDKNGKRLIFSLNNWIISMSGIHYVIIIFFTLAVSVRTLYTTRKKLTTLIDSYVWINFLWSVKEENCTRIIVIKETNNFIYHIRRTIVHRHSHARTIINYNTYSCSSDVTQWTYYCVTGPAIMSYTDWCHRSVGIRALINDGGVHSASRRWTASPVCTYLNIRLRASAHCLLVSNLWLDI